jgi:hypothetical protein
MQSEDLIELRARLSALTLIVESLLANVLMRATDEGRERYINQLRAAAQETRHLEGRAKTEDQSVELSDLQVAMQREVERILAEVQRGLFQGPT